MYSTISLSHNDMDGVGSQFSIKETRDGALYLNTGYDGISEYIDIVIDNLSELTNEVFLTDLSFQLSDLKKLERMVNSYSNIKFIYIDHHEYDDQCFELFEKLKQRENFIFIHSIKASATKLTYLYLKPSNKNLEKLVSIINSYDIWLENDPLFKIGWVFNTLFWDIKIKGWTIQVETNDYKMPSFFKRRYKEILTEKNEYFKKLFEANYITVDSNKKFMFAFADNFIPFLTVDFSEYQVYLIATSYNRISIRFRNLHPDIAMKIKKEIVDTSIMLPSVTSAGGHLNAFGVTVSNDTSFEQFKTILQSIQEKIYEFDFGELVNI